MSDQPLPDRRVVNTILSVLRRLAEGEYIYLSKCGHTLKMNDDMSLQLVLTMPGDMGEFARFLDHGELRLSELSELLRIEGLWPGD